MHAPTYFSDFASDIPVDKLAFEGNNPDAITIILMRAVLR